MNEEERRQYFYLAGKNPEYDRIAKKLLANRTILAWILKYCVEEFKESEISDIRDKYIQGTPEVASTPVLPDATNAGKANYIQGDANEDVTATEGQVTFDIRFRAITPADEPLELIINVEAQKNANPGYPLLKRAMYYCSRLISSQHGVDFDKSHYEKIKRSIASGFAWIQPMSKVASPDIKCKKKWNMVRFEKNEPITTCSRLSWCMWAIASEMQEIGF